MTNTSSTPRRVEIFRPDYAVLPFEKKRYYPRSIIWICMLFVFLFIFWASTFYVDQVVRMNGKLVSVSPRIVRQPIQSAILSELNYRVGEIVEAGKVIARLDSSFSTKQLDSLKRQRTALEWKITRIDAELQQIPFHFSSTDEDYLLQKEIFDNRTISRKKELELLFEKKKLHSNRMPITMAILKDLESEQLILDERIAGYKQKSKDLAKSSVLFNLKRERFRSSIQLGELEKKYQLDLGEIVISDAEYLKKEHDTKRSLGEEKSKTKERIQSLNTEIFKFERQRNLSILTTPFDARILSITDKSVGSVIREGEEVVSLVPLNDGLEVDANFEAKDRAKIEEMDLVAIKIEAYPFQQFGSLTGSVRSVSPGTFTQETDKAGTQFYQLRASIAGNSEKIKVHKLQPGMTVVVEVLSEPELLINLLVNPIRKAFDQMFDHAKQ